MKLELNRNDTKHVGVLDEDAERPRAVDVWQSVLGRLQAALPRPMYETWLKHTLGVRWDGETFVVEVRTAFQAAWLERRMYTAIQQTVEKVTGVPADISFRLPDSPWNHPVMEKRSRKLEDEWLVGPVRLRSETHRESNLLDVSDTTAGHIVGSRQIGSGREAPGGPVDYPTWIRRQRERLERRSQMASRSGFDREDRRPVLDHLAYPKGLDILHLLPGLLREGSVKNPGIVIASYPNLQAHIRIEHPDGRTAIVDRDDFCDGGEVIWTDRGTAILKDLQTGVHCAEEVEIKGMSTKGFCLLRPPGLRDYTWFAPRQPEEAGGQNRPTRLTDGTSFHIYAVESINVDADVLTEYEDISGVVVKLQASERSPGRHRDHLGLGH